MAAINKRVVLVDKSKFEIVEEPIPDPPANGIVVKVAYAGICHTDVHIAHKFFNIKNFVVPRVMGHEISGTVHEIGSGVNQTASDLKKGDRVVVFPWGHCNNCDLCSNDITYCRNMILPTGYSLPDSYTYGIWKDGGYQNYVVVHDPSFLVKVPDEIPLEKAAMVPCSAITAYHASTKLRDSVTEAIKIRGVARVGVVGTGGLALWAIPIVKAMYPDVKVTAIDLVKEKLDDAKTQGADEVFQWSKDGDVPSVIEHYKKTFGGEAYLDGIIDFTGIAAVQLRAFGLLNVGGTLVFVGLTEVMTTSVNLLEIVYKTASIKGVIVGTRAHTVEVFKLLLEGKVQPPPITIVTLEDVEGVINKLRDGTMRGRAVVKL